MAMLHGVHGAVADIPALDDWSRNVFADYSGPDRKDGLIAPNGDRYLIKYSERHSRVNDLDTSYVNNVLSEYIASHVLALCGFDAHETLSATRGGNFDRHMGNWGYLVSRRDGFLRPSPMYDNGSTLCPALPDKNMAEMPEDRHAIAERTLLFPNAALTLRKGWPKVNYRDMLTSGYDDDFSQAVCRVVPAILEAMPRVERFIGEQTFLSETRRRFYIVMLRARTALILRPAYEACDSKVFDAMARERLEKGQAYSPAHFERDYQAVAHSPVWDGILG